MSELLLKGATMTNAHCTDCGDPIFRYDGQEFCPTCQKPVARDEDAADGDGDHIEVADPSDEATVQFGNDQAADGSATAADAAPTDGAAEPDHAPDMGGDPAGHPPADDAPAHEPQPSPSRDTADPRQDAPASSDANEPAAELSAAESLLAETVHRFAQRAAETDDPRRAREHLGAAREAAEALDAVRY